MSTTTLATIATKSLYRRSHLYLSSTPNSPVELIPQTSGPSAQPPQIAILGPPPPKAPLAWLWKCHQCGRSYSLAVTRRCLDDGHHFCAGDHTVTRTVRGRRMKRRCRGKACTSEFDYAGWSAWGQWRANELRLRGEDDMKDDENGIVRQNCERNCLYPSQCRWGTPVKVSTTVGVIVETVEVDANGDIGAGDANATAAEVITGHIAMHVDEVDVADGSSDHIGAAF